MTDRPALLFQGIVTGIFIGAAIVFVWMVAPPEVEQRCKAACHKIDHDRWALDHYKGCICADRKIVWSKPPAHLPRASEQETD